MSKNVINNQNFLSLLLSTSKEQAIALLQTSTKDQLLLIAEIAHNILQLPLPKKAKHYVNKKKKIIERLADKKLSQTRKFSLVEKNAQFLLQLLLSIKSQLNELQ